MLKNHKHGSKGITYSRCTMEVQCLLEIWAEENVQEPLGAVHKKFEIFGKIPNSYSCSMIK